MAKIVRARSPFLWLRRALLACGVLALGAIGLMLAAYRFGSTRGDDAERRAVNTGDKIFIGQDFDYTQTSEGKPVFRIRAERSRQERDDTAHLEAVVLDIFHEDGETYTVTSDRATFNEHSWQAQLEGHVVVRGWSRLEIETRALELRQEGQVLVSSGAVEFRYPPDFAGRASSLHVDRRTNTIALGGGVHIHSVPGAAEELRLDSERVVYQQGSGPPGAARGRAGHPAGRRTRSGVVRAVGEVSLRRGQESIAAHTLTVFLEDDLKTVDSLRAHWDVVGRLEAVTEAGEATRIEFRGQYLEMKTDPSRNGSQTIQLDGEEQQATLKIADGTGLARILSGRYLTAQAKNGRLVHVEGIGDPLVVREALDLDEPYILRQACAERATARFLPDGSLARVKLESRVELSDQALHLSGGSQAFLNLENGMFEIEGPAVELYNERAEVTAPRITYSRDTGLIRTAGGVHATLAERSVSALAETPFGQGRGPIRVESEEALWTAEPPTFSFRGGVRAWRDQSLLLADQLRGDEASREVAASGNVKTVWIPADASSSGSATPIEVTSQRMTYMQNQSRLIYDGEVAVHQARRTIACKEMVVELAEGGGAAERMICNHAVRLVDPDGGRRVEGDRAVYTLPREQVEFFGERVLLDAEGAQLVGKYLLYDLGAGTVRLASRLPEAADEGGP
ncbi:MAG: LPS export ABC transporter periplasmic protein LptC [bacterium]|nr:LPS export ABC transporter periplasmic protein LptC [bacterium]